MSQLEGPLELIWPCVTLRFSNFSFARNTFYPVKFYGVPLIQVGVQVLDPAT